MKRIQVYIPFLEPYRQTEDEGQEAEEEDEKHNALVLAPPPIGASLPWRRLNLLTVRAIDVLLGRRSVGSDGQL